MRRGPALALLWLAACGGGTAGPTPATPASSAPGSTAPGRAAGAAADAVGLGPAASRTPAGVAPAAPAARGNGPLAPSGLAAELDALGLDRQSLPPLDKMEPAKLRKVMKTFSKALGTTCAGCHDTNDFRASTPKKRVASRMWDAYVRGLVLADGSALYCDSCHQGRIAFLDRHDPKGLERWMESEYVTKLRRADGHEHDCATCHGDEMNMRFLAAWSKPTRG